VRLWRFGGLIVALKQTGGVRPCCSSCRSPNERFTKLKQRSAEASLDPFQVATIAG
jgi:hypothetical protein